MRRRLPRIAALLVLLTVLVYGAAETLVYSRAMQVDASCFDSPREVWGRTARRPSTPKACTTSRRSIQPPT